MTAAKKWERGEWTGLEAGTVLGLVGGVSVGLPNGSSVLARRAKSCLTDPEPGDQVLCALGPEAAWVIAVLEGAPGQPHRISTEASLELRASRGSVSVVASGPVELTSGDRVSLVGPELHARAGAATFAIDRLGVVSREVSAHLDRARIVAEQADHFVGRLVQRARSVFRFVEGTDQTRAGSVDLRAENLLGLRGENAIISARVVAKVDGEQIHIG